MDQEYIGQSSGSTTLPDLHPNATASFDNGIDEIDLAVLANPTKMKPEITKLSEHEQDEVTEEEKMHFEEASRTADEILMDGMETAGFHDQNPTSVANPAGGFVPSPPLQDERFFKIPQPIPPEDVVEPDYPNLAGADDPIDSYHNIFTAPQSDLEASGIATNNVLAREAQSARTQPVRVNFGDNIVNTFDNSVLAATQAATQQQQQSIQQQQLVDEKKKKSKSRSSSSSSSGNSNGQSVSVSSRAQTESDVVGYKQDLKERQRQHRKKEKRRRERLPHERTYGELQEERYEDWEKKIQNDVQEAINTEKRELLLLFAEKEAEGYKMLRKFNMSSDINEMRFWFYKLLRDSRTDDEVAHLRSHLVEGTRLLLTLNDKVFDNPLGLSDMIDFPDALSSMLSGVWDRHIRDYVKSKHSLQGPPPQPLKNLGLNFLHLFVSHHRKKAAEEQKEKAERDKLQREAVLAASKNGTLAQSPYEAIFGNHRTSLMRGREGINPMELPHYAQSVQQNQMHQDPQYQEYLQWKKTKEQAEYQAFLDAKSQGRPNRIPDAAAEARNSSMKMAPTVSLAQKKQPVPPPPSFLKDTMSRMNLSASPLPNDLGAPDVASIDASGDFRAPTSHNDRVATASMTHASNSRLVGSQKEVSRSEKQLLLSVDESATASSSSSSSSSASRPRPPLPQLQVASRKAAGESPSRNVLPRAYQELSPGAKLLQKIAKTGKMDEKQMPALPVPAISRESVQKLQKQLGQRIVEQEKTEKKVTTTTKQVPEKTALKAIRPVDREKIAQLIQKAKPMSKFEPPASESSGSTQDESDHTKSESTSTGQQSKSSDSGTQESESEYDRILREMEEECEELDDKAVVAELNDVKFVPMGAKAIDDNNKDNRIIDMLKMFQAFMAEPPKGTRPTAQSSMFSDVDSLLETDGAESSSSVTKKKTKKEKISKRRRMQVGESQENSSEKTDEDAESNKSSTTSFKLTSENQDLARHKIDSNGRFTF